LRKLVVGGEEQTPVEGQARKKCKVQGSQNGEGWWQEQQGGELIDTHERRVSKHGPHPMQCLQGCVLSWQGESKVLSDTYVYSTKKRDESTRQW